MILLMALTLAMCVLIAGCIVHAGRSAWVHRGFEAFAQGRVEDGGSNLYVNANGVIEMIHVDLNPRRHEG